MAEINPSTTHTFFFLKIYMYKSLHTEYSKKESYIVLSDICKQEKRRRHIHSNDRKSSTMVLCVPLSKIPNSSNYTARKFGAFPQYSAHLLGQHERNSVTIQIFWEESIILVVYWEGQKPKCKKDQCFLESRMQEIRISNKGGWIKKCK